MDRIGLQQPIVVQTRAEGGYEVLIGQRRLLAAQRLAWTDIPALVVEGTLSELEAKAVSFSENVQRRDLSAADKSDVCAYLLGKLGNVKAVVDYVGASETTVRKWLGLAAAPAPVKRLVQEGRLSPTIAGRIAQAAGSDETAVALAESIAARQPTKDERDRILHAAHDFRGEPAEVILRRADERRERKTIIFSLPDEYQRALELACRELDRDDADIAEEATISWLDAHLYRL